MNRITDYLKYQHCKLSRYCTRTVYNKKKDYYIGGLFRRSKNVPVTWTEVKEAVYFSRNMKRRRHKSDYMYSLGIDYDKYTSTFSTIWFNVECEKIEIN